MTRANWTSATAWLDRPPPFHPWKLFFKAYPTKSLSLPLYPTIFSLYPSGLSHSLSTTYYFKDIDDLITDTFALFVERNAEALSAFWSSVEGDLQEMAAVLADDPGARGSLVERIVELAVQYVQVQLTERREHLLAEQAFRQEALLNPRLRELADAHQRILSLGAVHFFQVLGSGQPEQDAKVLTSIILQMEYQGLVDGVEQLAVDEMRAILRRYLNLVMGL